jgi:DNA-binding MarR family transcriptional regulator
MSTSTLDPVIHHPERLRIAATLVALPPGDGLTVTRLRGLLGLTPAHLSARLRELVQIGYIRTEKVGDGGDVTVVALTSNGRSALGRYAAALEQPARLAQVPQPAPDPALRASDADREATAVALSEHFAQGRLTLEELHTRLSAALTATTYGDLAEVVRDLS